MSWVNSVHRQFLPHGPSVLPFVGLHLLSIPRLARLGSSFSLFTRLPSLAGRVRSGKATEVSRTRRYAERRGRMRREEEPTRLRSDRQSSYRSPSPFPWASPVGHFVSHSRYACRLPPYLSRPIVGPKGPPYGRIGRGTEDKRRDGR